MDVDRSVRAMEKDVMYIAKDVISPGDRHKAVDPGYDVLKNRLRWRIRRARRTLQERARIQQSIPLKGERD